MGPETPPQWLVKVAERPDTDAIFLAFQPSARPGLVGKIRTVVEPNTTWTTGRNALLEEAVGMQQRQGWSHEYFVFADADPGIDPENATTFHRRLSALQPALAALGKRNKCDPFPCSADVDAQFNAFHATAVPIYLPYDASLDNTSWWASQSLMIAAFLTTAPEYAVEFKDIGHAVKNRHSTYPRGFSRDAVKERLYNRSSSCVQDGPLQNGNVRRGVSKMGRGHNCRRQCNLTAACQNNTFCEGPQEPAPRDFGKLIQCKPF